MMIFRQIFTNLLSYELELVGLIHSVGGTLLLQFEEGD